MKCDQFLRRRFLFFVGWTRTTHMTCKYFTFFFFLNSKDFFSVSLFHIVNKIDRYKLFTRCLEVCGGAHLGAVLRKTRAARRGVSEQHVLQALDWEHKLEVFGGGNKVAWFHAASLGEALSVKRLVAQALDQENDVVMTFSSASMLQYMHRGTSRAGYFQRLLTRYGANRFAFGYAPLDLPNQARGFVQSVQPNVAVFVESEIWPNLIRETRDFGSRMVLVNGRMSQESFERWMRFGITQRLIGECLDSFDKIMAQSNGEADRFARLSTRFQVHDIVVHDLKQERVVEDVEGDDWNLSNVKIRNRAWIAGSTHPDEELVIAKCHEELVISKGCRGLITIIAPRHPERVGKILEQIQSSLVQSKSEVLLFSELALFSEERMDAFLGSGPKLVLVDTIGDLKNLYGLVDIAFIGGSLEESSLSGNHNVYEPLHQGCGLILQGTNTPVIQDQPYVSKVTHKNDIIDQVFTHFSRHELKERSCIDDAKKPVMEFSDLLS